MEALFLGIGVVGSYVFQMTTEVNFCCKHRTSIAAIPIMTFSLPKGYPIQEDLVINKQDLVKDNMFHLKLFLLSR